MSVKKQNPSLSKLYTIYEEVREIFLDETDLDSYFYNNILDIALSIIELFELAKVAKKTFCFRTISVLHFEKSTKIHF